MELKANRIFFLDVFCFSCRLIVGSLKQIGSIIFEAATVYRIYYHSDNFVLKNRYFYLLIV